MVHSIALFALAWLVFVMLGSASFIPQRVLVDKESSQSLDYDTHFFQEQKPHPYLIEEVAGHHNETVGILTFVDPSHVYDKDTMQFSGYLDVPSKRKLFFW